MISGNCVTLMIKSSVTERVHGLIPVAVTRNRTSLLSTAGL